MMGYADYGFTPNVWRPSEVPARFSGEDLLADITATDKTITRNIGSPSLWTLRSSLTTPIAVSTGTVTFWTGTVPANSPHSILYVVFSIDAGAGANAWTAKLLDVNNNVVQTIDWQGNTGTMVWGLVAEGGFPVMTSSIVGSGAVSMTWQPAPLLPITWNPDVDPLNTSRYFTATIGDRRGGGSHTLTMTLRRFWSHIC